MGFRQHEDAKTRLVILDEHRRRPRRAGARRPYVTANASTRRVGAAGGDDGGFCCEWQGTWHACPTGVTECAGNSCCMTGVEFCVLPDGNTQCCDPGWICSPSSGTCCDPAPYPECQGWWCCYRQ